MPESIQHKLDRVRPPRVQITYDVEIGDAIEKKELPFVVGIMADLSGMPEADLSADRPDPASFNGKTRPKKDGVKQPTPLKERKYIEIDRDNFNSVMESIAPRLVLSVKTESMPPRGYTPQEEAEYRKSKGLRDDDQLPPTLFKPQEQEAPTQVELEFLTLDDFSPIHIVKQVRFLRDLLEARNNLSDLLTKLDGNPELEALLGASLNDPDKLKQLQAAATTGDDDKKGAQ
jgi:type VI secretion system protein ImpB